MHFMQEGANRNWKMEMAAQRMYRRAFADRQLPNPQTIGHFHWELCVSVDSFMFPGVTLAVEEITEFLQ